MTFLCEALENVVYQEVLATSENTKQHFYFLKIIAACATISSETIRPAWDAAIRKLQLCIYANTVIASNRLVNNFDVISHSVATLFIKCTRDSSFVRSIIFYFSYVFEKKKLTRNVNVLRCLTNRHPTASLGFCVSSRNLKDKRTWHDLHPRSWDELT